MSDDGVDYEAIYRNECHAVQCRINSAVANTLAAASFKPLTGIILRENYVGSKGVLPILTLLAANPTVQHLDLSHNGMDNAAVIELCRIGKTHYGLTHIDISYNDCTQSVGKELISLVETNPRIVALHAEGNGLYQSLLSRLELSVSHNREMVKDLPQVHPLREQPAPPPLGGPAVRTVEEPVRSAPKEECAQETAVVVNARNRVKPRPVPPPAASHGYRRMTQQEREEARTNYNRKLKTQSDNLATYIPNANRITPSLAARKKLETLQREQDQEEGGVNLEAEDLQRRVVESHATQKQKDLSNKTAALYPDDPEQDEIFAVSSEAASRPLSQDALKQLEKQDLQFAIAEGQQKDAAKRRQRLSAVEDERERLIGQQDGLTENLNVALEGSHGGGGPSEEAEQDATSNPPASPQGAAESQKADSCPDSPTPQQPRERAEATQMQIPEGIDAEGMKFYQHFNEGGQAYNKGRLEEAYQAWVLALEVATACKNREWISIINGNIQTLSYQLLTSQGDDHLLRKELEEALKCLQLARDVAFKAHNKTWEKAAEDSMNSVRRAQFRECFDKAMLTFEPLVREMEKKGTLPTETPFERQWRRVHCLKESLDLWTHALRYAVQITGRDGRDLTSMVESVVHVAFECQVSFSFAPADDMRIRHSAQGTHLLTSPQRENLISVWESIQESLKDLNSAEWLALTWSILGNLRHSLFQNKLAEQCFLKSLEGEGGDLIHAASETHLGRVYVGLARYSEAEKLLISADKLWVQLRERYTAAHASEEKQKQEKKAPKKEDAKTKTKPGGVQETTLDAYIFNENSQRAIYTVQQQYMLYDMLQQIMVSQYRYTEGLEMAERMRALTHMDKLNDKMHENFNTNTTCDHMLSICRSCQSVLVVYSTTVKYEWDIEKGEPVAFEQLFIWVMPPEGEIKFVLINVTQDYSGVSLEHIIDSLRSALCVEPDNDNLTDTPQKAKKNKVIVDQPSYAWKHPLQQLYDFLIYPISDFLTVNAGLEFAPHRKVTFVPHSFLHLVPWAALMDTMGRFLIESFNIQVAPSVQVMALAKLNATKLPERGQKVAVVNGAVQRHAELPYPFYDPLDEESASVAEGLNVGVLGGGKEAVLAGMSGARMIHIAAEVLAEYAEGSSWGGFVVDDGVLASRQIEVAELAAELVVVPACNHSKQALLRGGDGVVEMCRAFASAGAPSVVYSLWATPHQSSAQLLSTFYNNLRNQPDKAICLSSAQRKACQSDPYGPASWASLYLFGVSSL